MSTSHPVSSRASAARIAKWSASLLARGPGYRMAAAAGVLALGCVAFGAQSASATPKGGIVALTLTKAANPISYNRLGQVIQYTLVATNVGGITLSAVSISDLGLPSLACTPAQPAVLAPGAALTCTGSHTITQDDLDAHSFSNTATAAGFDPQAQLVTTTASATVIALSLLTNASGPVVVGQAIHDVASLGGGAPPLGGVINFEVFAPGDTACQTPIAVVPGIPVNGAGDYQSGDFTTTAAGVYRWIARFVGNTPGLVANTGCNDPNESSTVARATPTLSTVASAGVAAGNSISDSATIVAGFNPTGTITFTLFGPNNTTCTGTPAFTSTLPVSGNGTYVSGALVTSLAGTYRWIASYSGDPNNNPVTGACGAPGESVDVLKATPAVTTAATPAGNAPIGTSLSDTATLAGGVNPTGTIIFRLFGPNDPSCSGTPAFTSAAVPVNGNGSYASDSFTPTATGTYSWIASYSGDANNNPAADTCALPQETIQLAPLIPALGPPGLLLLLLGLAAAGGIALRRIR
jgi:hypothetical protein